MSPATLDYAFCYTSLVRRSLASAGSAESAYVMVYFRGHRGNSFASASLNLWEEELKAGLFSLERRFSSMSQLNA